MTTLDIYMPLDLAEDKEDQSHVTLGFTERISLKSRLDLPYVHAGSKVGRSRP